LDPAGSIILDRRLIEGHCLGFDSGGVCSGRTDQSLRADLLPGTSGKEEKRNTERNRHGYTDRGPTQPLL
jgi:hypothetical protein